MSLHQLQENERESDDGHEPHRRAQPRNARDIDHGVGKARLEEDLRADERRRIGLARDHRDEHQRGEEHQALQHVVVRARRAAGPSGARREPFAVSGERGQSHLQG